MFAHSLEKVFDSRSYKNINLTNLSFYFNWKNDVRIFHWFELRMNKGFIQIEDKCFSANFIFPWGTNQPVLICLLTTILFILLPLIINLCHLHHLVNATLILGNLAYNLIESIWTLVCLLLFWFLNFLLLDFLILFSIILQFLFLSLILFYFDLDFWEMNISVWCVLDILVYRYLLNKLSWILRLNKGLRDATISCILTSLGWSLLGKQS